MLRFRYEASDASERLISGEIEASTVSEAIALLAEQGLTVQSIGLVPSASAGPKARPEFPVGKLARKTGPRHSMSRDEVLQPLRPAFTQMLERSKPLAPILARLAEETPPGRRRQQLQLVRRAIEQGEAGAALASFSARSDVWLALLAATAEETSPAEAFERFIARSRQIDDLRRQWARALAYPAALALVAVTILFLLSILVVPTFRDIFVSFNVAKPLLTTVLFAVSDSVVSGKAALWLVGGAAVLLGARLALRRLPDSITVPLARWTGFLPGRATRAGRLALDVADLLRAGLSPSDALILAGEIPGQRSLTDGARQFAQYLRGDLIADPLGDSFGLTASFVYALRCEASRDTRIRLLDELSQCHFERARRRPSLAAGILGPILILVVGLLVAGAVIGLFQPLFQLVNNLA